MIIILTQDKDQIIEWNHMYRIGTEVRASREGVEDYMVIGTYPTEERAKRVILEIFATMKGGSVETENGYINRVKDIYFEMPKE